MKHSQKWLDAHKNVSNTATPPATINGYTDEQWASASKQFQSHLGTGADAEINDEPLGPDGATPNSIVAAVNAKSVDGAKYLAAYAGSGLLTL